MESGKAVCGNINMIVSDSSNQLAAIAASSAFPVVLVIPAPFGSTKLELPELGW